jgi:hypothetical protein
MLVERALVSKIGQPACALEADNTERALALLDEIECGASVEPTAEARLAQLFATRLRSRLATHGDGGGALTSQVAMTVWTWPATFDTLV